MTDDLARAAVSDRLAALARPSVRLRSGPRPPPGESGRRLLETYRTVVTLASVEDVSGAVEVAAGGFHCLALLGDGTVLAWGCNDEGQLGDGTRIDRAEPVPVEGLTRATAISAGTSHSMAILNDGTVVTWGGNDHGRLGDGTAVRRRLTPTPTRAIPARVTRVAAGGHHSVALTEDGAVYTWGWSRPNGTAVPTRIMGPPPVVVGIATGTSRSLAVTDDGSVFAWTIGDWVPPRVAGVENVVAATVTDHAQMVLRADGSAWAWGLNFRGELADGTTENRDVPVACSALPPHIAAVAMGREGGVALLENGAVWDWGDRRAPAALAGLEEGVRAVDVGHSNLALMDDGTIRWWGMGPPIRDGAESAGDSTPIGESKLGGRPDLPEEVPWPTTDGWPLCFVGQVNLAAMPPLSGETEGLPDDGVMSFFYDLERFPSGYEPSDRGGGAVLYTPAGAPLGRRAFPADLAAFYWFGVVALTASVELTLPSVASVLPAGEVLSDEESTTLWNIEMNAMDNFEPVHHLGGYEQPVQHGHVQARMCQFASNGVALYGGETDEARLRDLEPGVQDWRLLAQFDSDDAAGMTWGDAGRLYFWIRREDLAARRFDDVWVITQCH